MSEENEPRPTSTPPKVREMKVLTKGILDVAALLTLGLLAWTQSWDWQISVGCVFTILGLMRFSPIAKSGGPLAFLISAVSTAASVSKV